MSAKPGRVDGGVQQSHRPPHLAQLRHPSPSQYKGKVFEVVLKGGRPWGFTVSGGLEMQSALVISEIEEGSKAHLSDSLQVGDVVLEVNDVQCAAQSEAEQLIQSAFNTITLTLQRGQSDFEPTSPKSIDFYKRVKDLQEKEKENQSMLSTHQPEVVGSHIKEYSGGGVKMRLNKKDPPQESYRPKSWHHKYEEHRQEPDVVKNQHHEYVSKSRTFSPPGTTSSSFNSEHRAWKDRGYNSSSHLEMMRASTTSLINFNEKPKAQSLHRGPGHVKQISHAYDDMSHKARSSSQRIDQVEQRNTPAMFQSLNLDRQADFYPNNRNDFSEPNREQKWRTQHQTTAGQTAEPLWAKTKNLERNDSFTRRVEQVRENRNIPVQRVHAQPQPEHKQYRVEMTTNLGRGYSMSALTNNADRQISQNPTWRDSQSSLRQQQNSSPANAVKRSELTYLISSDGSQPKNDEPLFKDQYSTQRPQEYARPPPPPQPVSPTPREQSPAPPPPPLRDSSMKSFIKYHDKSPSWPLHAYGAKKPASETEDGPVHAKAHTWSAENNYAQEKGGVKATTQENPEVEVFEGHRAQVRTLPVANRPEEKTFAYQAHLERGPEKFRSEYQEEKPKTQYHPVQVSPTGGYFIDGKHYQYPPSSKFEVHTATVYQVEMDEPMHAGIPAAPVNTEPKFAKPYEYDAKYDVPSPPTRDIPLETQELQPDLVNLDSPLPPRRRDSAKFSPERVQSPESLNSTLRSAGSAENIIQKYESLLRNNLVEQGYDSHPQPTKAADVVRSQVPEEVPPKSHYQRRLSRDKAREFAVKPETDGQAPHDIMQPNVEQAPMMNGYQEESKQAVTSEPRPSSAGKGKDDGWREDITHLDDEEASTLKRWWNSPCDYQVLPGMGTGLSKRCGMSPGEETVKKFEYSLNEKGSGDDKPVLSDANLSNDSREELSRTSPQYPGLADASQQSSFTKLQEQPPRHAESEKEGISEGEKYPAGTSFHSPSDSHTQYSDKYKHGEPIDLLQKDRERHRDREQVLRKQIYSTDTKTPVSPTNEKVSILSHLQRERDQSNIHEGYAKVKDLSAKFRSMEDSSGKPKAKRDNFFMGTSHAEERPPEVVPHNRTQSLGRDAKLPANTEHFRRFDADSKSASMNVRSPSAEVNKFYDHVKSDDGRHPRSMSYAYDPTSPSRAFAQGQEKPHGGGVDEEHRSRSSDSKRRPSKKLSDPRRTSDPRKGSDPSKLSDSQSQVMFQRSVEFEGARRHAEEMPKKRVADHDRQHRTSDPYREEYNSRRSTSDPKTERRRSDPKREHKRSDPKAETQPDHRYSKSDSEKYHKEPASQQWHKRSDPTSRVKRRQPSDPEEKRRMKDALRSFYNAKTGQYFIPQLSGAHAKLETTESTASLASSLKVPAYMDPSSKVEVAYQAKQNAPKRSASSSSFRHASESSAPSMPRTKSEVVRPTSMPPNAYNQSDILKKQHSFSMSAVPARDSTLSSVSSYRERPSSGGSPPASLAGSNKHLSPNQSQESILEIALRRHQKHLVEPQPKFDKTASLPGSGRTGRGPPVKVSTSEAIMKMFTSSQMRTTSPPLAGKPEPAPTHRPSTATQNRAPPIGHVEKSSTLPVSFRSGDSNAPSSVSSWLSSVDLPKKSNQAFQKAALSKTAPPPMQATTTTTNKVHHGNLVMVEFVPSADDSDDSSSDEEETVKPSVAKQQRSFEQKPRQTEGEFFSFPPSKTVEEAMTLRGETTNESRETDTHPTAKDQLNLVRQLQAQNQPGLLKVEDDRKNKFRYLTTDSFILPTPPESPSHEVVFDEDDDLPPPPPELLIDSPEARDDSAIQRTRSQTPTPSLTSSTSEDNILEKVEKSANMHPQTSMLSTETYRSYTGRHYARGPLAQSTASSMSSLTGLSERTSSPVNTARPVSPMKTSLSPSPQPEKKRDSPTASSASTVQTSVKLTLSKPPSPKPAFTSPPPFTPMRRLGPAKSLETVSKSPSPTKTSPTRPTFGRLAAYSSVQEMKLKYETKGKGEDLKHLNLKSPTRIRADSFDQMDSKPPKEENKPTERLAVQKTSPVTAVGRTSPEQRKDVKAADIIEDKDTYTEKAEKEMSENKKEDQVTEEKKEEKTPEVKAPKEKSAEDLKAEELTKTICSESNDKSLSCILAPMQRTTEDYINGLGFPTASEEQKRRRQSTSRVLNGEKSGERKAPPPKKPDPALLLPATSPYYGISAVKALLLNENKHSQEDMENIPEDSEELNQKKEELIDSISKKLEGLKEEQEKLHEENAENEELGRQVTQLAKSVCKESEFDKYQLFVDELAKIINLLMSLSGRLARAENALGNLDPAECDPETRQTLEEKRDKLHMQYEEAKTLKEGIDRRNDQVCVNLRKYLNDEQYADFEHFVSMKSDLIMTTRQLNDKVKLGEEQLHALKESMTQCNKLSR